jgi:hypothetical protein
VALLGDDEAAGRWMGAATPFLDSSFRGTVRLPGLAPVTFLGLEGLRDLWQGWLGQWASFRVEVEDVIDSGERVVVVDRGYGRREPDAPEEMLRRASFWTVSDHKVAHIDFNILVAEALAAVKPAS